MKTIKLLIASLAIALLLTGCGTAYATVSDQNKALVTIGNDKITKGDLLKQMLSFDGGSAAIKGATAFIVNSEVETTDELNKQADETLATYVTVYGKDDLDAALKYLGYETKDEILTDILLSLKTTEVLKRYANEHISELFTEYKPVKIKLLHITTQTDETETFAERAAKALEEIRGGAEFADVAENYISDKDDLALAKEFLVLNTNTTLDANVKKFLETATSPVLSDVIESKDGKSAYIVSVTTTNQAQLTEDFVDYLINSVDTFSTKAMASYFTKYNFRVFDTDLYNLLKDNYKELLVQD